MTPLGTLRKLCIAATLSLAAMVAIAEQATIVLNDGSKILGEVVSLKSGHYKIKTGSLGEINLKQEDVKVIQYSKGASVALPTSPTQPAAAASNPQLASRFQGVQERIARNPEMMSQIQSMAQDPALQAIINDPEIKRAVESGDFGSLMSNPKIHQLMNHSTVKEITQQIK